MVFFGKVMNWVNVGYKLDKRLNLAEWSWESFKKHFKSNFCEC
jgi:hypothetical protein